MSCKEILQYVLICISTRHLRFFLPRPDHHVSDGARVLAVIDVMKTMAPRIFENPLSPSPLSLFYLFSLLFCQNELWSSWRALTRSSDPNRNGRDEENRFKIKVSLPFSPTELSNRQGRVSRSLTYWTEMDRGPFHSRIFCFHNIRKTPIPVAKCIFYRIGFSPLLQ